ncbi:hypothetical protein VTO42DRAFT_4742 [Malbranchea cinnamomea]
MPDTSSDIQASLPPVPSPSNPVLIATQSQWIFTDAELHRTPSVLDGMPIEQEHTSRSKGVNFITQVGILLKLPQLTLSTASVYLHRFFMRYSMVDLPQRPGMHPYAIAATALFLATKVEENCRKMRELIIACCRVALKQPNLVVDEQSKEFWKWRDTILHNEDILLEALCFDLQLEQPYRLLYDFLCYFKVQDNKRLRNSAWAFVNDSTYTVLCVQFTARTIAAAALYAAARHCDVAFKDDQFDRPWWEQIDVDIKQVRRACNRMAELYERHPLPDRAPKYAPTPINGEEGEIMDKTRLLRKTEESTPTNRATSQPPSEANGRKRERDEASETDPSKHQPNGAAVPPPEAERSPKRQRRNSDEPDGKPDFSASSSTQPQSSQMSSSLHTATDSSNAVATQTDHSGPQESKDDTQTSCTRPSEPPSGAESSNTAKEHPNSSQRPPPPSQTESKDNSESDSKPRGSPRKSRIPAAAQSAQKTAQRFPHRRDNPEHNNGDDKRPPENNP